jgi:hypothetical protein
MPKKYSGFITPEQVRSDPSIRALVGRMTEFFFPKTVAAGNKAQHNGIQGTPTEPQEKNV